MTSKKEIERNKWEQRISVSSRLVETELHTSWKRTLDNYRGLYNTGSRPGEFSVAVNVVQSITGVVVPAIYFRDPNVRAIPRIPNTELQAKFTESLINYYIRELNFKRQAKRVTTDAWLFGVGYFKIGWEVDVDRSFDPILDPETNEPLYDGQGNPLLNDDSGSVFASEQGVVRKLLEPDGTLAFPGREYPTLNEYIRRESPFAIRWSPWDVLKDPFSLMPDCSDAEWVAFRTSMPVDEVRNHPFWENNKNVEPTSEPDFIRSLRSRDDVKGLEEMDRVIIYEIYHKVYDKKTNSWTMRLKIMAEGHDKFLLDEPSPYKIEGFPLVAVSFIENPESPYPLSPVEVVRPQIDVINAARSQATNFRERFNQKYLFNKSAGITERDARRFAMGRIGSVLGVRMDSPDSDPSKAFRPAEVPLMDQNINQEVANAWEDVQRQLGVNDHHFGGAGPARQATQATYIEQALGVRLNEKQDILGDAITEVCRKWKQLFQQYGDYQMAFKLTGVDEQTWQTFVVAENVPDDLEFFVDMNTSSFQSAQAEKAEMLELLNIVANLQEVDRRPILERLFKTFGFPTPEVLIRPPAPPQAPEEQAGSLTESAIDTSSANRALNEQATAENAGLQLVG